jgi:selenium metabolism protein YedF
VESQTVDARGLACPQPVIQTRNALRESGTLSVGQSVTVIVDNDTAQKNVTRMAEKLGHTVETEIKADGIYLHVRAQAPTERTGLTVGKVDELPVGKAIIYGPPQPLVLVVPSEFMGRGEHVELGNILVRAFFHTLGEVEPLPQTIVFFNSGVKLVAQGSHVLEDLCALSEQGIEILACGTCLEYYGLKDKLAVGEISNMYTIAETMLGAGRVVKL